MSVVPTNCATCKWWVRDTSGSRSFGFCRRHSPNPTTAAVERHAGGCVSRWPRVFSLDWCGEYEKEPHT